MDPARSADPHSLARHAIAGATMGTRWTAVFHGAVDLVATASALQEAVDAVDRQMSTWRPDSDLCRLNDAAVGAWVGIPPDLAAVLATGLEICRASAGAFDMAVGDVVEALGFGPRGGPPDPAVLRRRSGRRIPSREGLAVDVAGGRARRTADIRLDLSGIAKGFAVDRMGRALDRIGLRSWLVGIDGEMRARGTKADGEAWTVAVERPDDTRRDPMGVMALVGAAVATSGDYRHFADLGGERVSHVVDPRTGLPLRNGIAAVTVLAGTCVEADAWATALMVLGPEAGPALARARRIDALFVVRDGPRDEGRLHEIGVGVFDAAA